MADPVQWAATQALSQQRLFIASFLSERNIVFPAYKSHETVETF